MDPPDTIRGRGSAENPPNRFERLRYVEEAPLEGQPATRFLRDPSRSIITTNQSPDLGFDASINPYRGCEHGCIYCYARPSHEYLGFSAGLDFETRILVKEEAPRLLRQALASPGFEPRVLVMSGVTDPYQPVERRLKLTRRCLAVLAEARNPCSLITKNRLVIRDVDLLAELAAHDATSVCVSVTTLDPDLHRCMEPRTSSPELRLSAIETLAEAGIPVGVMVAPVIPGLNDHEIPRILEAAAARGAGFAACVLLRLPGAVAPLFQAWLERHHLGRKDKVLARIREVRGGRLNDARFGTRHTGQGLYAEQIRRLFRVARRRAGLAERGPSLSTEAFRRPGGSQLGLFSSTAS